MCVCPRAWWVINQKDKYIQNSLVVYTHGVYYLPIHKLAKSEQKKKPSASLLGFYYIFSTWQQLLSILIDQQNKSNNDDDHHHYHRWWIINWFFFMAVCCRFFLFFSWKWNSWINEWNGNKTIRFVMHFFHHYFKFSNQTYPGFFCGFIILECHFIFHLDVSRNKGQQNSPSKI